MSYYRSSIRSLFLPFLLFLCCLGQSAGAATAAQDASAESVPRAEQIESVLQTLEDPEQRERLIASLRVLLEANAQQTAQAEAQSVKTAAAELVETVADKLGALAGSVDALTGVAEEIPALSKGWWLELQDPATRTQRAKIVGRLALVLGAGFAAAALVNWGVRRVRGRAQPTRRGMWSRALGLSGRLLGDIVPIVAFALAAYAVLTLVDPRQETRLVAVALINASILTRAVQAVSAFFLAPDAPQLRLWDTSDETAHYVHVWVQRLSVITLYGFFGLQAAVLLGLESGAYETLLRLLGLVVLGLLLVLVAQNREQVAQAIAAAPRADSDEPAQLSSLRRGLARVWHLIAGVYLVAIYAIWALRVENGAQFVLKATLISLLAVALARLLMRGADHLFERGLRLSTELRTQFPGLEQRLNRYFPVLRKILKAVIAAVAALVVIDAWGIDALTWATEGSGRVLLGALLNILLIVVVALFLWELTSGSVERYLAETDAQGRVRARSPRIRTLLTVARNALLVVLAVVATLMVLSELGINIAPLLAGAGVVGLAIGFGAQRLVQDVINGAFILLQDLMAVGDVVKLGDKAGVVEALSIRTVRLRDLSGTVHTIPFSAIEGVSNLTREFAFHVFDIGIAYREDVDEVIALLQAIGAELQADAEIGPLILEPLEVFGLDAFGDSAIVIKGRIKTRPIKQWQVGRAFNRLVKKRFDERGIEIPFPHTTLYFGQDKNGAAPPAFVQLEAMLRDSGGAQGAGGGSAGA